MEVEVLMDVTVGGRAFVRQLLDSMEQALAGGLTRQERDSLRREVTDAILLAWPLANAPLMAASTSELVRLFRWVGPVSDGLPQPTGPMKVFRGQVCGEPGMAWTEDQMEARSYAGGWATAGASAVYEAVIPPEGVLARFRSRREVVVDPSFISSRRVVMTFAHFMPCNPFAHCQHMWTMRP